VPNQTNEMYQIAHPTCIGVNKIGITTSSLIIVFEFLFNIFFSRLFIHNYVNLIIWLLFAHIFTRADKKFAEKHLMSIY
jgi:hypothetical protein